MDKDLLEYLVSQGLKEFLLEEGYDFQNLTFSDLQGDGWGYHQFRAKEKGKKAFIICAEEDEGMVFSINQI